MWGEEREGKPPPPPPLLNPSLPFTYLNAVNVIITKGMFRDAVGTNPV